MGKEIKRDLQLLFFTFILITLISATYFFDSIRAKPFGITITTIALSYFLLICRLRGTKFKNYFYNSIDSFFPLPKESIFIRGENIETHIEEDSKEERWMRAYSADGKLNQALFSILFILILAVIALFIFKIQQFNLFYVALAVGGVCVIRTTSVVQLQTYPIIMLLFPVVFKTAEMKICGRTIALFASYFICMASYSIIEKNNIYQKLKIVRARVDLISSSLRGAWQMLLLFTLSLTLFDYIIPNYKDRTDTQKNSKSISPIQSYNRSLGKVLHQNQVKLNAEVLLPAGNFSIDPTKIINQYQINLKSMSKMMNKINLQPAAGNVTIDLNQMNNRFQMLQNDFSNFQENISGSDPLTAQEIEEFLKLQQKLTDLDQQMRKQIQKLGSPSDRENSQQKMPTLKEILKRDLTNDGSKVISNPEIMKKFGGSENLAALNDAIEQIDNKLNSDNPSGLAQDINNYQQAKKDFKKELAKEQAKPKLTIPELQLEKILKFLKFFGGIALIIIVLTLLKKLFSKPQTDLKVTPSNKRATIKRALEKKKYHTIRSEVIDLYNRFQECIKKIKYPDCEVPPPLLLRQKWIKESKNQDQHIHYFTELFSQCFYREKEIEIEQLNSYRKAYRKLIKDLG